MAEKLTFVSRYRGFLIVLVVLIHTSITYLAAGFWYYAEVNDVLWFKVAGTFVCSIAQSFALGAFFFFSAYFLPGSLDRKGTAKFLLDRIVKLAIPFVAYTFIINPLLVMAVASWGYGKRIPVGPYFGSGPLWFVEVLFIFTLVYIGARKVFGHAPSFLPRWEGVPPRRIVLGYIIAAAALGFCARILFPIGWSFYNLQFGFFPMYIILFAAGIKAGKEKWLDAVARTPIGFWAALAGAGLIAFPIVLAVEGPKSGIAPFMGGLTWQNAAYAVWEAATGTAIFIVSIVLFSRVRWRRGLMGRQSIGDSFANSSFGIYVLHAVFIIFAALAMKQLPLHPALKWVILSCVGVLAPWGLTEGLRRIPGFSRVL